MFEYVVGDNELSKVLAKFSETTGDIGLDIETNGLDPYTNKWLLLQLNMNDSIFILNVSSLSNKMLTYLMQLINDSKRIIVGHNLKFDLKFIYHNTKELICQVFDTQIAESLAYAGLREGIYPSYMGICKKYLGEIIEKDIRKEFIDHDGKVFTEEQLIYSAIDVKYLFSLKEILTTKLIEQKQDRVMKLEMELVPVFADMEYTGIKLNKDLWIKNSQDLLEEFNNIKTDILDLYSDNINYNDYNNLYDLFRQVKIPVTTKKLRLELENILPQFFRGWLRNNLNLNSKPQNLVMIRSFGIDVPNTNEKTLTAYKKEKIVNMLLNYREYEKLIDTYGDNFLEFINPVTVRIHTNLNQLGTSTGRISSDTPNLQNIPKKQKYRTPFITDEDKLIITADYDQAELRLMGALSREPEILTACLNRQDLHKKSATIIYNKSIEEINNDERFYGKTLNFGLIYGISEYGLYRNFGIDLETGKKYLKKYFEGYKYISDFIKKTGDKVLENLYSTTLYGRKRFFEDKKLFSDTNERDKYYSRIKREGVNQCIQGGIADAIKLAMCLIYYGNPYSDKLKLLLQVHDELLIEVTKDISEEAINFVKDCMINALQPFLWKIPAEVDIKIGTYWNKED